MAMDRRAFLGITSAGALALTLPSAALAQAKKLGKIEYGLASLDRSALCDNQPLASTTPSP